MLKGKHIVLGISGGIAAYKSALLVRLFVKAGAEVQVIMTPNAKEFITPLTLSTLSGKPVISEFFTANTGQWNSHVDLGLWADYFIVTPATASTIAKMANGVADNMLVTSYLSTRAKVFVAPAMDFDMMSHPTTRRNIASLQADGVTIIESEVGELASHLVGKGRMAEPSTIYDTICTDSERSKDLTGKKIMITAGPTRENIDPVRYISNYSTGKMGIALADAAAQRGAEVTLILGPVEIRPSEAAVEVVNVTSADEMYRACQSAFPQCDIAIMSAAVADYSVTNRSDRKIKREHGEIPVLELVKNPDIAASLGNEKKPGQLLVGFALETDHEQANALEKLKRKNLDMIVLNSLRDKGAGFGTETNKIAIYTADSSVPVQYPLKSKKEVADDILSCIENFLRQQNT